MDPHREVIALGRGAVMDDSGEFTSQGEFPVSVPDAGETPVPEPTEEAPPEASGSLPGLDTTVGPSTEGDSVAP